MLAPPTRDLGTIDLSYMLGSQWFGSGDVNETIPDLMWPTSVQMYGRMRRDPKLKAILNAFSLPIRRASWVLDPAGCRDEVVQVVADDLGLPILGADIRPGPARRRGVKWGEHLRLALLSLVYGHAGFERRYEIRDGLARLVNLGERPPWTVSSFELNRDGTIKSVTQNAVGTKPIPASSLVWYAHEREGAAWTGQSLLREAYAPWLLKHEMWRVLSTSNRRFGMGIPSVKAPPGATPAQVIEAQRLASAMRAGDRSGVGLPAGFELAITGMTGSAPDTLAWIQYLDQQMSTMALAGFLDLGQTETGSRALGESFINLFMLSLQAIADELADVATSGAPGLNGIVTDIVDLNWGEDEPAPRIVCTDVGERRDLTAQGITELVQGGVITPDEELEAYVRQTYQLPARSAQPAPAPTPPAPAPTQARARRRKASAREVRAAGDPAAGHRQLTTVEAASGMDPDVIQSEWEAVRDLLVEDWEAITGEQHSALLDQIVDAIQTGALIKLGSMVVDAAGAAVRLAAAMLDMARAAIRTMIGEAKSQGVTIPDVDPDEDWLTEVAETVAATMAQSTAAAAGREALRVATPGRDGEEVADLVEAYWDSLGPAWHLEQLGGALTAAQNHGRFTAAQNAPKQARYVASEVLDHNTCPSCFEIDGTEFTSPEEAEAAYANGGYVGCEGRLRCRGILAAVWDD